ncbi:MAG: hypothetical protein NTY15_03740 [Planctomycetota bacterium]|nr:hypothetical protein [Planctomycetota bacterium]
MDQKSVWLVLYVCLAIMFSSDTTNGQLDGDDRLPSPPWRQGIPLHLVLVKEVQVDIAMNDESIKKIKGMLEEKGIVGRNRVEHSKVSSDELIQRTLSEVLSLEQIDRLHQIHVQQMGRHAVLDANVAKAIGLNDDELRQLRVAQRTYFQESRANAKKRDTASLSKIEAKRDREWDSIMTAERKIALAKLGGKTLNLRSP